MANLNRIILIGRLTADPEMRFTVEGSAVTKYRMSVDRPPRSDGAESGTDFIPVVAFGRLAEVSGEYLKKGKLALVEGRIQVRSYSTDDGQNKWVTEVVASSMKLLDKTESGKKEATETDPFAESSPEPAGIMSDGPVDDDIPF
jgi:single-strand DNA-binding protein